MRPVVQRAFLFAPMARDPVGVLAYRVQRADPARARALPDAPAPGAASHLRLSQRYGFTWNNACEQGAGTDRNSSGIPAATPAGRAGFEAAGLDVRRETVLTASALREPPHPNRAARFRQLRGDGWQQSAQLRAVCDAEDGPPAGRAFAEARDAARRRLAEAGHGAWFGAFVDGELAAQLGVFSGGTGIARYQDVETHPDARRQGLAGTLVFHAARYAIDQLGATTLVIVTDPGESAIRVYRSVGFANREIQHAAPAQRGLIGRPCLPLPITGPRLEPFWQR